MVGLLMYRLSFYTLLPPQSALTHRPKCVVPLGSWVEFLGPGGQGRLQGLLLGLLLLLGVPGFCGAQRRPVCRHTGEDC